MSFLINPFKASDPEFICSSAVQGINTDYGTGTTQVYEVPFYGLYNYGESAHIYPQSQIGSGKAITGVGFYFAGWTVPYTFSAVEIWIAHTTATDFPAGITVGYSAITITDLTKVYSGSWTNSVNNAIQFVNLAPKFCYNGTDNLLIICKNFDGTWTSGYGYTRNTAVANYRQAYVYQDPSYPANGTAMTRVQRSMNLRLYY